MPLDIFNLEQLAPPFFLFCFTLITKYVQLNNCLQCFVFFSIVLGFMFDDVVSSFMLLEDCGVLVHNQGHLGVVHSHCDVLQILLFGLRDIGLELAEKVVGCNLYNIEIDPHNKTQSIERSIGSKLHQITEFVTHNLST